ncbi:MAG TPA: hypothetical protein VK841_11925 [Polyangiaceae bacterium]|nr:hypothetical protein [Polyangiaceae bacterium]
MKRTPRPRAVVSVTAAMVSQLTCLQLLGVDPRRYLDEVVPRCKGDVTSLGQLRIVPLDIAVAALRRLALTDQGEEAPARVERQPETADEVLAALGLERA